MLLYKFRSLQNIEFVLDVILNERLHCALYSELNDPFEGLFHSVFKPNPYNSPIPSFINKVTTCKTIEDLQVDIERFKICSLSKSFNDVRLWSNYADGHKGIAIEIDFSGNEEDIHEVKYVPKLKEYGITLLTRPEPAEVLSFKSEHWEYEDECRIIQEEKYYPITGCIKRIYTGHRISELHSGLLGKVAPSQIPIIPTKINTHKIIVQPIESEDGK